MRNDDAVSEGRNGSQITQAYVLLAAGKLRECAAIAEQLARANPADPRVWHVLSNVYSRIGQHHLALQCASRAVALAPADAAFLINRGLCLVATGNRRDAIEVAERVAALKLERAELEDALGTLFTFCEDPKRALPFFLRAVELAPSNSSFIYNLATAQRMIGEFAAAEERLDQVIAINPGDIEAYATRSTLRTQTREANHVGRLSELLQRAAPDSSDEIALGFALSKELEDMGRYQESFTYLKRANDAHRKRIHYDVETDIAAMKAIARWHDETAMAVEGGFDTEECLFVIGLPRSGTTLVERILSSHTGVMAAGELQAFPSELSKAVGKHAGGKRDAVDFPRSALDVDPAALGRAYIEATRPQTGKTRHFVDKLPLNYLNAGMIRRALPRARIVALARSPMDSCYALYKTRFAGAYNFSYDLSDLAHYYAAWHALMRHWKAVLGENLLIVQYEDLVTSQEHMTRRILAHCRLDWQKACLEFHRQEGAVTSASAAQVRQSMYTSSLGKWRQLETELHILSSELAELEPPSGWRFG